MGRFKRECSRSKSPLRRAFDRLQTNLSKRCSNVSKRYLFRLTWRNVIEVQNVGYGHMVFDKGLHNGPVEKGFYDGVLRGIEYLKQTFYDSLSVKLYKKFHKRVCRNMKKGGFTLIDGKDAGNFRDVTNSMIWSMGPYSKYINSQDAFDRLNKLFHETGLGKVEKRILGCDAGDECAPMRYQIAYTKFSKKVVKKLVKRAFARYERKLKKANKKKDNDKKLKAIALLFKRLEMIHPFIDGNGRTNILILQRELLRNGFPPVKMDFYLMDVASKRYTTTLLKRAVKSALKAINYTNVLS